jgi:hypothetical protein
VLGESVGGLPSKLSSVLIYSNEDDRIQYARKAQAICSRLQPDDVTRLRAGLLVPDLEVPGVVEARIIVGISERRRPVPTKMVAALIDAVRPLVSGAAPIRMIIFETASTLSDADEDNPGLKTLVAALKQIARELGVAVVLVHHTSQAAATNLPGLNFSVADIRGGTALAFNTRQCFLLVSLGSNDDPLGDKDMRTALRAYVAPYSPDRLTALICLDSSKSIDPPPVFLAWMPTEHGPAMAEIAVPSEIAGARWRKVRQTVKDWTGKERKEQKAEQASTDVAECISTVTRLHFEGRHPTVRAVSRAMGHGNDWAQSRLEAGVRRGHLVRTQEHVPQTKGKTDVYRPAKKHDHDDPSEPAGAPTGGGASAHLLEDSDPSDEPD